MEILEVSSGYTWFPDNNKELAFFVLVTLFFLIGLTPVLVPIHEFIHAGIGSLEGASIIEIHVGFDTSQWISSNYPTSKSIGLKEQSGEVLGVCMMNGVNGNRGIPHLLYEYWWIGILLGVSMLLGYITMALITNRTYILYDDGDWGVKNSDVSSKR